MSSQCELMFCIRMWVTMQSPQVSTNSRLSTFNSLHLELCGPNDSSVARTWVSSWIDMNLSFQHSHTAEAKVSLQAHFNNGIFSRRTFTHFARPARSDLVQIACMCHSLQQKRLRQLQNNQAKGMCRRLYLLETTDFFCRLYGLSVRQLTTHEITCNNHDHNWRHL